MKPLFWRHANHTNFGDELNRYIWDSYGVSKYFSNDPGLLYGIGTILRDSMPTERPLIVFGSGMGYTKAPIPRDLEIMFVRGPLTSLLMDGAPWITDPAIVTARYKAPRTQTSTVFMPHWETIVQNEGLSETLATVGIEVLDPREDIESLLVRMSRAKLVLSEAMHGVIVADALRIPWIPIYIQHGHLFKWLDWAESMEVKYLPAFAEITAIDDIAKSYSPTLSRDAVHEDRLSRVEEQMDKLKKRLSR